MLDNAYDLQICLWNMLKLSSKTCLTASVNHPYLSSSLVVSILLYVLFPLVFWILVYSTPLIVCSLIALNVLKRPKENIEVDAKIDHQKRKKAKFASERVQSVRRRRAKEITAETVNNEDKTNILENELLKLHAMLQQDEEEEKCVIPVIDCVDKTEVLIEDPPKEIREVEQVESPKFRHRNEYEITSEDDHKNNKMEIGVSDSERTKRLESLIARRRSRKMMNPSIINKEIIVTKIPNIIIPKIAGYNSNKIARPFSPGPGSAPSVLIPMRNPFDLPYDPQEEKLDLTGDSFDQEFTVTNSSCRDITFSRHESFTMTTNRDFGFRRRFSRTSDDFSEKGFPPIVNQKTEAALESKSNPDEDEIKEVIKVDDNHTERINGYESETRQVPQSDFNSSSSSPSSSEDDQPFHKISREAVLKSLSSMRRNAIDIDQVLDENLSYANSALENASRLKQQYYDEKAVRRHVYAGSYSVASDMQVEVSEVSSPPLTIDEDGSRVEATEDDDSEFSDQLMNDEAHQSHDPHVEESSVEKYNHTYEPVDDEVKIGENEDQLVQHTAECLSKSDESVDNEAKIQEKNEDHQPEEVAVNSNGHEEERSAASNQDAFTRNLDQPEVVIRECTKDEVIKIKENDDQSKEVAISGTDHNEESTSRSTTSEQNVDQSED